MKKIRAYNGWVKIKNISKFRRPCDDFMQSFTFKNNILSVNYKSSLELKLITVFDKSDFVDWWAIEPIGLSYICPITKTTKRYFFDFLASIDGKIHMFEIKSSSVKHKPKKPLNPRNEKKAQEYFESAIETWEINNAKWEAARAFCESKNYESFTVLDENDIQAIYDFTLPNG